MKSANYYRVRAVVRAVFWLALLAGLYLIGICLHLTAGEKWLIDNQINGDDGTGFNDYWEREDTGKLYSTAYGLVSAEELNKIEREANY